MTVPGKWCPIEVGAKIEVFTLAQMRVAGTLVGIEHGPTEDAATLLVQESGYDTPTVVPWTSVGAIRTDYTGAF